MFLIVLLWLWFTYHFKGPVHSPQSVIFVVFQHRELAGWHDCFSHYQDKATKVLISGS